MKILHLSTYDTKGGGAISTYRLHHGLIKLGIDSSMMVYEKQSADDSVINYRWPANKWQRYKRKKRRQRIQQDYQKYKSSIPDGFEQFNDVRTPNFNLVEQIPDVDLINLHWVAGFVDIANLLTVIKDKPIVWRLSDQNPITGGCHYDAGCGKFISGCHNCPQLGSNNDKDLSHWIWQQKKKLFDQIDSSRFHFIAQSNWMADLVGESEIFNKFNCTVVPNGLDINIFKPLDREYSRNLFNIPQDKTVILFVSDSISNKRKGLDYLLKALQHLSNNESVLLCAVGRNKIENLSFKNFVHLGSISDPRLLSIAYAMSDLHIIPSVQDNLANTVIESLCCGTPVIGFPIGGNLDMIESGVNGLLSKNVSVEALRISIDEFLHNPDVFDRNKISKLASDKYNHEAQALTISNLYKDIIDTFKRNN